MFLFFEGIFEGRSNLFINTDEILSDLDWDGPVFSISAETSVGTEKLKNELMRRLNELNLSENN